MPHSATRRIKRSANLLLVTERRVLLLRRARGTPNGGRWGLPGGQRERGEHPYQTACREALEEVGFLPRYAVCDALTVRRRGKRCDVYVCRVPDRDARSWLPSLNEEHEGYRWASPRWCARHPKQLHPVLRRLFASERGLERVLRAMHDKPAVPQQSFRDASAPALPAALGLAA